MKCPKCNEEALFVNGKYVCVDCGIEITPEEQANQYNSNNLLDAQPLTSPANPITTPDPQVFQDPTPQPLTSTDDKQDPVQSEPASIQSEAGSSLQSASSIEPLNEPLGTPTNFKPDSNQSQDDLSSPEETTTQVDPVAQSQVVDPAPFPVSVVEDEVSPAAADPANVNVEKPVEDYYKQELENADQVQAGGVYDFSDNNIPTSTPGSNPPLDSQTQPQSTVTTGLENQTNQKELDINQGQNIEFNSEAPSEAPAVEGQQLGQLEQTEVPVSQAPSQVSTVVPDFPLPENNLIETNPSFSEQSLGSQSELDINASNLAVTEGTNVPIQVDDKANFGNETQVFSAPSPEFEKQEVGSSVQSQPPSDTVSTEYFQPSTFELSKPDFQYQGTEMAPEITSNQDEMGPNNVNTVQADNLQDSFVPEPETNLTGENLKEDKVSVESSLVPSENSQLSEETVIPLDIEATNSTSLTTESIQQESSMPSVESVFGSNESSNEPSNPQDYGLPAPIPPNENKKKMIIIGAIVGIIVIALFALLAFFVRGNSNPYPVTLSKDSVTQLSTLITEAMDQKQDIAVKYQIEANFQGLVPKGTAPDKYKEVFAQPYQSSGDWLADKDSNIHILSTTNGKNTRQTYISSGANTFTYDEATDKWIKSQGNNIKSVPSFIDPNARGTALYVPNINSISQVAIENLNGINTDVFVIKPEKGFIGNLSFLGATFAEATFLSTDASKLNVKVWIGRDDRRIYKIEVNGNLIVDGADFTGDIVFTSSATFEYKSVLIKNPEEAAATSPPLTRKFDYKMREEDGWPSSLNEVRSLI